MIEPDVLHSGSQILQRNPNARAFVVVLLVFAAQVGGCGERAGSASVAAVAGPGSSAGSCNNAPAGFCNEFTGASYKAATAQRSCEAQKMQYLAGGCPTVGQVGTCLVKKGTAAESTYRYYGTFPGMALPGGVTAAASAQMQCSESLKGEWRAQ